RARRRQRLVGLKGWTTGIPISEFLSFLPMLAKLRFDQLRTPNWLSTSLAVDGRRRNMVGPTNTAGGVAPPRAPADARPAAKPLAPPGGAADGEALGGPLGATAARRAPKSNCTATAGT